MPERNFANRTLYHGDNLDFMRGMNSGTVNLIATDPPFNESRGFHATPDTLAAGAQFQDRWSWQDDIHDEWLIAIQRDEPEVWHVITAAKEVYGDDMAAFLCWLGVRLLEMHRLLAGDGSLYLHIDSTAHAWVKCLMDAIFGKSNFRNEIVWKRSHAHSSAKRYGPVHDTLLFYSKTDKYCWTDQRQPYDYAYVKRYFKFDDNDGRGLYWTGDLTGSGIRHGETGQSWQGFDPTTKGRHWMNPPSVLDELNTDNRIYWPKTRTAWPKLKRYLSEAKGVPLQDIMDDIYSLQTMGGKKHERMGYPTQKPLALYERIIEASSNPGDMVLDPFCGCATTPVAAERTGRQCVGMDIWDGAHQMVLDRLETEGMAVRGRRRRQLLTFGDITYSKTPPKRTDDGEPATLVLRTPTGRAQRLPPPRTHHGRLLTDLGAFCQGCGADYQFDPRVLEVDHINPRSQGGTDAYENLTLLCPPCNKEKRDRYTLIGLQQFNRAMVT